MTELRLANVFHLGIKELRSLWRDKLLLMLVILNFSGMIYLAGSAGAKELNRAPVGIVDQDRSAISTRIRDALLPPHFLPPETIEYDAIDSALDEGRFTFVLVIPADFELDVRAGQDTAIQLNIDATRMSQAFIGSSYIQEIISDETTRFLQSEVGAGPLPVELVTRVAFNPNLDGVWFGGVMEIINQITMLSIILTGAALIREREHGTIEHLLVMPLRPAEIMLAKVWANGSVVLIAAALSLWLVVQGALGVPVLGSTWLFLAGAAVHLFSTTSIGILLGTVARTMPQFGLLILLTILPLQMLSGGITPRESMPGIVQDLMLAAPTTHFVKLAQGVLYRGAGIEIIWPQFLALVGIGAVFFVTAIYLLRRSLALGH
jgi:ABC-2 type transport system permease protein